MKKIILCKLVSRVIELSEADDKAKALLGRHTPDERYAIIDWFRNTDDAVLVMVQQMADGMDLGQYEVETDGPEDTYWPAALLQLRSRSERNGFKETAQ